ncbi:hypothetical protein MWH28_00225 [Natroniella sulfidigena]|uniref:hypothetical protein n=1 Tax=Natroniella sulfidigena TaxID=723921 RepID=UPI00200A60A1|nr:hypothetical protein [Natroniella sulfidigena]MCK8815791.1 hypothetical protein [Natroniella sulfidigena]
MDLRLYNCPICYEDTLHEVVGLNSDYLTVRCTSCATTSAVEEEGFNGYEEASIELNQELNGLLDEFDY